MDHLIHLISIVVRHRLRKGKKEEKSYKSNIDSRYKKKVEYGHYKWMVGANYIIKNTITIQRMEIKSVL